MNAEELAALNDEIVGMARAGLPLDQGLAALAKEMGRGRLRRVTAALADDLRAGRTLPEALQRQAGRVPPYYAGLVTAGVRSGRVTEVLATLTVYARTIANLRTTVIDALFYPAVVLAFGLVLVGVLFFFIIPQFDQIFKDFNLRLPMVTMILLGIGRHPLEMVVIPLATILAGVFLLRVCLGLTERGRCVWAQLVYAVPVIGTLIRSARLAAFTDLLAILVDNQLPLPEAFRLAGAASSDPIMAAAARQVHDDLSQGAPLGEVLRGRGLVPEWVAWMTALGERRGTLAPTLRQIAETYRRQAEMRSAMLRSVLPPFLIILTAGMFTAFFVIALMLPLLKLLEGLSQ
ncbi:MAG TPA: type II secretion system F family protein [Gemmataceae bacterium]|nr:type II secretion system F family protein [Gemmataceae bacterium]